jgi:hypothetical protein
MLHAACYYELQVYAMQHQDELLELLIEWQINGLNDRDINSLMFIGGHGGSLANEYNTHWRGFMARLREHQQSLPASVSSIMDWLLKTHGW